MKWALRLFVLLLVLLLAYTVWPLYGLYRLGAAVQARDAAALSELIEYRSLRQSVSQQLIAVALKASGKTSALGSLADVAAAAGANMLDPLVSEFVDPPSLIAFLHDGKSPIEGAPETFAPLNPSAIGSAWQTWLNSEYSGRNFYVSLPPNRPAADRVRLRLYLTSWRWKLAGIELPESLRQRLMQVLATRLR